MQKNGWNRSTGQRQGLAIEFVPGSCLIKARSLEQITLL
jgi:hypothetical protein